MLFMVYFIFMLLVDLQGMQSNRELQNKKNQWVFVKHYSIPPAATKSKKAIFSFKVKVKVTRTLTLLSFERASLVEYTCQI